MDFNSFHKKTSQTIEKTLKDYLESWERSTNKISPDLPKLTSSFLQINEGGKKIRGVLVILGYQLAGGKKFSSIITPAVAYEIFHNAVLAHDDITDQSLTRRGKPSLYQQLGGNHYGISQAIFLSDLGFFLSYKLLSESKFSDNSKIEVLKLFSETLISTTIGELLDIEVPETADFTEEKSLQISSLKTANYTISGPLLIGATLAGAEKKLLLQLEDLGENLGVAFQIQDDILGIFGSSTDTGKSSLSDIKEAKASILISQALKQANKDDLKYLKHHYGKKEISKKEVIQLKEIFIKTGSLDYANSKIKEKIENAKQIIDTLKTSQEYKNLLLGFSDYLCDRKK